MKNETMKKMNTFNVTSSAEKVQLSNKYKQYEEFFNNHIGGSGMIGDESYLELWNQSEIEELNEDYEVFEFLNDIILIGSDGGDTAYGVNSKGQYIEVPFIGMEDKEVKIIAENFDDFISFLWNK